MVHRTMELSHKSNYPPPKNYRVIWDKQKSLVKIQFRSTKNEFHRRIN